MFAIEWAKSHDLDPAPDSMVLAEWFILAHISDCTRWSGTSLFPPPFPPTNLHCKLCCLIISPDNPVHVSSLSFAFYLLSSSLNPISPLSSCLSQSSVSPRLIQHRHLNVLACLTNPTPTPRPFSLYPRNYARIFMAMSLFHSSLSYPLFCITISFSFQFNLPSFGDCWLKFWLVERPANII